MCGRGSAHFREGIRGKVLLAESRNVVPNPYATARYAAEILKGRMALNAALLLAAVWIITSGVGLLPEYLRLKPAETAWDIISDPESRYEREAEKLTFDKGSYHDLINDGTNANIAASDATRSAVSSDGRLWLNDLTGLRKTQRENELRTTKVAEKLFCGDKAEPMLIFGKNGFTASIAEDGSSYATFFHEEYRYKIADGWAEEYKEEGNSTFSSVTTRLSEILKKQDAEPITPEEMAGLLYFSAKGVLLDYQEGTAVFADKMTDSSRAVIYRQTEGGEMEELFSFTNDYTGGGTGCIAADGKVYAIAGTEVLQYDPEGEEGLPVSIYNLGQQVLGLNYLCDQSGDVHIVCSDAEKIHFLYPTEKTHSEHAIAEAISNLYTLGDKVYSFRKVESDDDTKFFYLDKFKD
ncbi:MAG: hypothetical protein K1W40_16710 [Schaedlerella sp.]|uniref:hypothetical protein n=1 Tax=Schaedlerella sp. TaxID=2676057 RepID=UPI003526CF98